MSATAGNIELIVSVITAPPALVGAWVGIRQIRASTKADKALAVSERAQAIKDARDDERQHWLDRVAELTADRDREQRRADGLQELINQIRLGGAK